MYHIHIAAFVLQGHVNEVLLYNAETRRPFLKPIVYTSDPYEGVVTGIEFLGHFLAVLHKYSKEILFYDIKNCVDYSDEPCREIFRIDSRML
jgi:hypothetical protein